VLKRLLEVCSAENVVKTDEGLEAIIFTAQGDMRQALNNVQATHSGFGFVNSENVFKVCDQPHPLLVQKIVASCLNAEIDPAYKGMSRAFWVHLRLKVFTGLVDLWQLGYSPIDIIGTLMRVVKPYDMAEFTKLEFIREIGNTHLRLAAVMEV
jgi:replication factor C subunit 2/4